jgi:hypothetical protein
VLVQERRVRQSRRQHVVYSRQLFEIDLDARGDILSLGPCPAEAHSDELTDLAHLVACEHRLLGRLESRESGHGDDRLHAYEVGGSERLAAMLVRNVDRAQLCMGERRADESDIFHARKADIADILAAPAQEAVILLTLDRGAYALIAHLLTFLSPTLG